MAVVNYPFALWGELLCDPYHGWYYCATGATIDPSVLCLYLVLARIINYLIPLTLIWTAYTGIACRLWFTSIKVTGKRLENMKQPQALNGDHEKL